MQDLKQSYAELESRIIELEQLVSLQNKEEKKTVPLAISNYSFSDLVDVSDLQQLINHLSEITGCAIGILDVDNNFLASAGLQKICTCFHRIHPATNNHCSESDCFIRENLKTKTPIQYKCKNGLWDVAYPIFIEEKHAANIFLGQFFFEEEVIDIPYFERQAEKYGFDKTEYLNALHEVPIISQKKVNSLKLFNTAFAQLLTKTGYSNLLLKKEKVEELRIANQQLKESEIKFKKLFEQAGVGVAQVESSTGQFIKINKKFADILGYTLNEMMQLTFRDFTHPDDIEESLLFKDKLNSKKNKEYTIEKRYIRKDRSIIWVKLTTTAMWEVEEGSSYHISIVQDITDIKKSREDLKESEFKFRKLFELAGVGVAQVDISTGKFVKVNRKLAEMFGYTFDELLQLTFKQVTHPDDLKESLQNQKRLLKKQTGDFSIEKRYVRKDGTTVWASLTASSMGEIDGGDQFQIAVIQDITERKKSENDLKESEEKFKSIFYQSPVGLELYDYDGNLLDCNPANLAIFGIDNINDVKGFNLFETPILSKKQKRDILEGKNVLFEIELNFDAEKKSTLPNTTKTGNYFISCLATSFKTNGNNEAGFLLHMIDITERKKAEQTLKEENERFHASMDAIDSVVYVADMKNHEILFVNKYVKNVFGEITGKKCYSALQGKTAPCDFCTNHLILDANGIANQPHIWEFQNLITKKWYQCHDQAIQWTNGNLVRFEIATDITKNIENELALKANENKLHEINSSKDKLFSIIGHDLKNPFAVLKSSSELLSRYLEKNDLLKSKAKAEMIASASKHGYALLENLLAWAKSQSGGLKFEPQILNLKNRIDKIISEIAEQAGLKNIIVTNNAPDDLLIEADENLLSAVFRNLITNAIKFSHSGGTITINAKTNNNIIEVAVIDAGIGIPKEHQNKLFRLDTNFSRVGTANEPSTSLGLILCKEFIEKHNGKIWVESEADKGSEFRFTLPYVH